MYLYTEINKVVIFRRVHTHKPSECSALRSQKRESDWQWLKLWAVTSFLTGCQKTNSGPLEEQDVLSTTEPSMKAIETSFLRI